MNKNSLTIIVHLEQYYIEILIWLKTKSYDKKAYEKLSLKNLISINELVQIHFELAVLLPLEFLKHFGWK